jgi:hypothetical protein
VDPVSRPMAACGTPQKKQSEQILTFSHRCGARRYWRRE